MIKKAYDKLVRFCLKKSFLVWQRLGFHITPNHFHQPIPDTRTLKDDLWLRRSELVGIDINEKRQLELLSLFQHKFKEEYDKFPRNITSTSYEYYVNNYSFESVDAEILYSMIRFFKPKIIFEIGSGNSTFLSAQAVLKNKEEGNCECELIAFEPYPNKILKAGFPGLSKLISAKIEDIPLLEFYKLQENDILFIDSSHVLRIGGDVHYEFLNILPRLNKGVIIHIHDIFLPAEYPKEWVLKKYQFWTEQYLLQAFLSFNDNFEVLWASSYMHLNHPDRLENTFNSYKRDEKRPVSFWMRKIK